MADQGRWFKLWCSVLLDDHLQALPPATRWAWAALGCYLKQHGTSGSASINCHNQALAAAMGVPASELIVTLFSLPHVRVEEDKKRNGAHVVTMENWRKYQVDSTVAERVKALRSKRRGEEKRREETKNIPPTAPPASLATMDERLKRAHLTPSLWQAMMKALDETRYLREAKRLREPEWWGAQLRACGEQTDPIHEINDAEAYFVRNPTRRAQYRDLARFLGNSMIRHAKEVAE